MTTRVLETLVRGGKRTRGQGLKVVERCIQLDLRTSMKFWKDRT